MNKQIQQVLIVMGDYKVVANWQYAGGALGKSAVGSMNDTGEYLIKFANANRLIVANTCFKQIRPNRRWTWESADGHTRNMIDPMLISSKRKGSVLNCMVYPAADIGSDHQLLVAKIRLRLKARKKSQEVKRFDVQKLCDTAVKTQYCADINDRLASLIENSRNGTARSVNEICSQITDSCNATSSTILGNIKS